MTKFDSWDWRIKILGPIFYSLAISGLFAYNFILEASLMKLLALILIISGYFFMLVARFQLKDKFSILPQAEKGLITDGIYSIFRHPVYIFSSLSAVGICLYLSILLNNILFSIFSFFLLSVYVYMQVCRAKKEEEKLIQKYGKEYLEYKKRSMF